MTKENIAYVVIILVIGFAMGAMTFAFNHVEEIPVVDIRSREIRDSLLMENKTLMTENDSLKQVNDSLYTSNLKLDSALLKSKQNDSKIRRKIMESTADSAFSIILNHIPDSTN